MKLVSIDAIQGTGLYSPLAGQELRTRGVVTGVSRRGFFLQDPEGDPEGEASIGIFVYERRGKPKVGSLVEVVGRALDFAKSEGARPATQIEEQETHVIQEQGPVIEPVWLTAERVLIPHAQLRSLLNSLEGMLVGLPKGSIFTAPSNPFGDYVVLPPGGPLLRTEMGGVLINPSEPERWLPGFRLLDYDEAPCVHVGAELLDPVIGPLNFRSDSFQISASGSARVGQSEVRLQPTTLVGEGAAVTVLTLNGFNLDPHIEDAAAVNDPRRDVDDDIQDGRFQTLGQAIARDAREPDIVALQEIQDDDGAEITEVVSAQRTLESLIRAIKKAGGPDYAWADVPPDALADGGQPGGNIRNAFLYRPERVSIVAGSLRRLGDSSPAYEGSRKPLMARFALVQGQGELDVINVHLASKRHQNGLFAPTDPGFDPREELRVEQARLIADELRPLREAGADYYVTGDFNDFEFSATLQELVGSSNVNLVDHVPGPLRFDYNHRGLSQALMHGIVAKRQLVDRQAQYEILHANALLGVQPGRSGQKPSDHGYVIARLELEPSSQR